MEGQGFQGIKDLWLCGAVVLLLVSVGGVMERLGYACGRFRHFDVAVAASAHTLPAVHRHQRDGRQRLEMRIAWPHAVDGNGLVHLRPLRSCRQEVAGDAGLDICGPAYIPVSAFQLQDIDVSHKRDSCRTSVSQKGQLSNFCFTKGTVVAHVCCVFVPRHPSPLHIARSNPPMLGRLQWKRQRVATTCALPHRAIQEALAQVFAQFLSVCAAMSRPACGQCGLGFIPSSVCCWRDVWFCSRVCAHAAGDHSACLGWDCGCTGYAKKRRLLRDHRTQMRIMQELIDDHDLASELEEDVVAQMGNNTFWLGYDTGFGGMDEGSDAEDPEADAKQEVQDLRQEATDQQGLVAAVQGALECRAIATDLERARMRLEDHRSLGIA